MTIRDELNNLNEFDVWSLMLFTLYKIRDIPEYSSLSELAYILDRKNLVKLCEYFGGSTIKIPTLEDMECITYGMILYQLVDVEGKDIDTAIESLSFVDKDMIKKIKSEYKKVRGVLTDYTLTSRSRI